MARKDRAEGGRTNRILAALESKDREQLLAETTLVSLEFKRVLLQPGEFDRLLP